MSIMDTLFGRKRSKKEKDEYDAAYRLERERLAPLEGKAEAEAAVKKRIIRLKEDSTPKKKSDGGNTVLDNFDPNQNLF